MLATFLFIAGITLAIAGLCLVAMEVNEPIHRGHLRGYIVPISLLSLTLCLTAVGLGA